VTYDVSALICVRNGEAYLAEAIESILAQTTRPHEILVVDDGSTDASRDVASAFAPHVTVHARPALGVGAARQHAVEASSGHLVAFLDSDDLWSSDYLELHVEAHRERPAIDATVSTVLPFLSPDVDPAAVTAAAESLEPRRGMLVAATVIRREAMHAVGPFDASLPFTDQDWLMRAVDAGLQFGDVPKATVRRRIHGNNYTLTASADFQGRLVILKRGLDRRRSARAQPENPGEEGS